MRVADDRRRTPPTRLAGSTVNEEVATTLEHQFARGRVKRIEIFEREGVRRRARIDAAKKKRLVLVDVADAGGDALIEQHVRDRPPRQASTVLHSESCRLPAIEVVGKYI